MIELNSKNITYKVGKFPFMANSRAKAIDEPEGFVKILADAKTDKVLGVHIIGPHAGEMIAEMAVDRKSTRLNSVTSRSRMPSSA